MIHNIIAGIKDDLKAKQLEVSVTEIQNEFLKILHKTMPSHWLIFSKIYWKTIFDKIDCI